MKDFTLNMSCVNTPSKDSEIEPEEFRLHSHIANYALNVYDASLCSTVEKQAKTMNLNIEDILLTNFKESSPDDDDHCPRFMLFLDHSTRSVVLAVRGTFSITDVIIDVVCDDEEFLDGYAHRGILRGAKKILAMASTAIEEALKSNKGKLINNFVANCNSVKRLRFFHVLLSTLRKMH